MSDPDGTNEPATPESAGDDRIDLSESFSHGAQMISSPPPSDSVAPQALLGTPEPQESPAPDGE